MRAPTDGELVVLHPSGVARRRRGALQPPLAAGLADGAGGDRRRDMADDVAQDAFERAFAALSRFDERRPFEPWLHRIVVNRVARPPAQRAAARSGSTRRIEGSGTTRPREDRALLQAVSALSLQRRVVIVLRYGLGTRRQRSRSARAAGRHDPLPAGAGARAAARTGEGARCPSELERRLERALGDAPGPDPGVIGSRPAGRLSTRCRPRPDRGGRATPARAAPAACVAAFVSGGVTLAATDGRLPGIGRVPTGPAPGTGASRRGGGRARRGDLGADRRPRPGRGAPGATSRITVCPDSGPGPARSTRSRRGRHLRAVQVATGRAAWRFRLAGTPTNPVWAPFPIRVAYLLHGRGGLEVHDIWGNGTHDFTVHASAAPVAPSWRWDSKAFAFVRGDGAVVVHDVIGGRDTALRPACGLRRAEAVAFAPSGGRLAIADRRGICAWSTRPATRPRSARRSPEGRRRSRGSGKPAPRGGRRKPCRAS